jgi:integrase
LRLLDTARRRPLIEALTIRRGARKGQTAGKVKPETQARLEEIGRERVLIYKTLVLTGLRKGELESLTVGQLYLDSSAAFAELNAADEKNREGNAVPIWADLADDLRAWLAGKLQRLQQQARENGEPLPLRLPAEMPLFNVPKGLRRILDRDLMLAGIPKRDERGRTVDVHALRTTFGTLLSKGGVAPRTAQAAMRHSDISLTMNVYTDPKLLDVHGALNALPVLPLGEKEIGAAKATGTGDLSASQHAPTVAPTVAPTPYKSGQ